MKNKIEEAKDALRDAQANYNRLCMLEELSKEPFEKQLKINLYNSAIVLECNTSIHRLIDAETAKALLEFFKQVLEDNS